MANSKRKILFWIFVCTMLGVCGYIWGPFSQLYEYDIIVPVEFVEVPKGLIQVDNKVQNIEVHVCGPKSEIDQLPNQNFKYSLSLAGAKIGITSFSIDPEKIDISKRFKIKSLNPSAVKVKIEKEGIRELTVNIVFAGKPSAGYVLADSIVTPNTILIRGPLKNLKDLEGVDTKPIDLTGATESFKKEIAPDIFENFEIASTFKVVQAAINITEKIVEKQFDEIPVLGKDTKRSYQIIPSKVSLTVTGPEKIIDKIDPEKDFHIYVDFKGLKKGVYARPAEIFLPVDVVLISIKPEVFTVTVK